MTTPPTAFDHPPERTTALPQPSFTPAEKAAGKRFRDDQTRILFESVEQQKAAIGPGDPELHVVVPFLANFRHRCGKTGNSKPITLQEQYNHSPAYTVLELTSEDGGDRHEFMVYEGDTLDGEGSSLVLSPRRLAIHQIPAGRFGFWWKTGKCNCGQRATSKVGKFEDSYLRPPLQGRVARKGS